MKSRFSFLSASVLGLSLLVAASGAVRAAPFFQGLGYNRPGYTISEAHGISADGSTVVGLSGFNLTAGDFEAFRWTMTGGMVGLGDLPGGAYSSAAYDVSGDGSVVVGQGNNGSLAAVLWTTPGSPQDLGSIGSSGNSFATGISDDGRVIVGWSDTSPFTLGEAVRWDRSGGATVPAGLGDLPGASSESIAHGVSGDGTVIVGRGTSASGPEAFRWTASGGMAGLGDLPGGAFASEAFAASFDGSVIVGQGTSASGSEAFRWTMTGGMVGLGDLPGGAYRSKALDVSADGSVVVGWADAPIPYFGDDPLDAFIWDSVHGMRLLQDVLTIDYGLDLKGWHLTQATSISADGLVIAGIGFNPIGQTEAWVANLRTGGDPAPVPEPMTLALFGIGLAGLGFLRRRTAA